MAMLSVHNLSKRYASFQLKQVNFELEEGYIMGFIGRNGAGKTTTLKAMLNLIHPDSGSVSVLGRDYQENEFWCKQQIGIVLGEFDYYGTKKLKTITDVTRRFFPQWDEALYQSYLHLFQLEPEKRVKELSAGMKVKYALALALSHQAKLLILDEPTSGLDPVSRDELLALFQHIVEDGQHSILFSTHITSDLDKCADYITYIKNGAIIESCDKETFTEQYRLVQGKNSELTADLTARMLGYKQTAFGFTGMVRASDLGNLPQGMQIAPADLESVMLYREKEA